MTPGVIDDEARRAFTNGQCHALALALNEETGWPMVQVGVHGYGGIPRHWMVETPNGDLLDIKGLSTYEDVADRWAGDIVSGEPEDAWALYENGNYRRPEVETARTFVPAVLEYVFVSD
ncbi:hypothetical protein [Amycolatopsis sp.]|uniref:hypothetical protein n=1 Tax=Amycolatopsis sp. TaxID=37632 RepID=UPI002D80B93F|nr:hypothetical protein [Amycolatopsis sp.]